MIRLIVISVDGLLLPRRNFWLELHQAFGTLSDGAALAKSFHSDRAQLVEAVVKELWAGRDAAPYERLVASYTPLPGAEELLAELDRFCAGRARVPRALVSSGCYDVVARLAKEGDIVFANQLVVKEGKIAGEHHWPVNGIYTRRQILEQLCSDFDILPQDILIIGASEDDADAFRIAGTSIAFNTKSKALREAATYVVGSSDPRDLIPVLERIRAAEGQTPADSPKI